MQNMNIWFLSAYEQPGGHTSRTYDYAQQLIKRGHRVTIFTNSYFHRSHTELLEPHEKYRVEEMDGVRVVWLKTIHYTGNGLSRGINMLSFAQRALQVAPQLPDKPDVVVGDSVPPSAGWVASRIADASKAAFVYQIRDVWPIALVYDGGLSRHSPVYYAFRHVEKTLYRKAQRICATMPFLHPHVKESGSDPAKITCVPNGVSLDRYRGYGDYDGGPKFPLTAMYVGAFGNAHDVITIIRAAAILQEKGDDRYRFVIVGSGVKKAECEREAAAKGLRNVQFGEPVEKDEVPALQERSDILIACVTDSKAYSFGINLNKLYDYFASGRPVIFSGHAPKNPVLESGAGFNIPPEDPQAMVEALERYADMSAAERKSLGNRARRYAEEEFDVARLGERMETMLAEAVRAKKSR